MKIINKMKRRSIVLLVFGLIIGLFAWHASLRVGTGPAVGEGLEDFPANRPGANATVRIGTLNMASGRGRDGQYDLGRAAKLFEAEKLDFVALQEVRGGFLFRTDNQVAMLGRFLRFGWLYAPAETRWHCRQFGGGVVSRLPVGHWQRIPLPRKHDRSYRNVVFLVLEHEGHTINVLATHVTQRDPRDRAVQIEAVTELFLAMRPPAILLGDLNSPPDDRAIRELLARVDVDDPIGRLAKDVPKGRVDWILVRGLRCVAAGVRDEGVSDHPLYWVEIETADDEK